MKSSKTIIPIRSLVNVLFLVLFVVLIIMQKVQIWFMLFAIGIVASIFLGRFYCGWACPMYTMFRPINWIMKKLRIKRAAPPPFLTSPIVRYGVLTAFLAVAAFQGITGTKIPVLLILTAIAVLITLFFQEELWHAHLCPLGTILFLSSKPSKRGMIISNDRCNGCGICQKVCPTDAIMEKPLAESAKTRTYETGGAPEADSGETTIISDKKATPSKTKRTVKLPQKTIIRSRCLNCFTCQVSCPKDAISYK